MALVVAMVLVGIGQVVFLVLAVNSAPVRAAEVARRVAPEVTEKVIADARAQRLANARGVLGAANRVLADRGLPMVADPGPQANAEQVLAAASSAQVLSVLPEDIVRRLRDRLAGDSIVLPSAMMNPAQGPPGSPNPDGPGAGAPPPGQQPGTGPVAPGAPPPSSPGAGQPAVPQAPPPPTAAPQPADPTQPPPTRRRLIPPIVPLPLPLIGI